MITDAKVLADVRQCWESVRKVQRGLQRDWFAQGVQINEHASKESYNLPLVLAYAVLDMVLTELYDQGVYSCKGWKSTRKAPPLGRKMEDSRVHVPWQDYSLVFDGKEKRNSLAHEAALVDKFECVTYVNAIETELRAWKILG
jgi:hypothetical protein